MKQPVILIILDGFGIAPDSQGNAIALAKTPVTDRLWREVPHTQLSASGEDVGLPAGQMGNSEVGHTNIGAGRVVYQELSRITRCRSERRTGTESGAPAGSGAYPCHRRQSALYGTAL